MYAAIEKLHLENLATLRAGENKSWPIHQTELCRAYHKLAGNSALQAEYYKSMKDKYSRAAAYPWERVLSDPRSRTTARTNHWNDNYRVLSELGVPGKTTNTTGHALNTTVTGRIPVAQLVSVHFLFAVSSVGFGF